jgi:membrane protease subunit HflK
MPWNNNPGGGGWKGGGGGPWGQGPQPRGPQPPDLEEILKRSQDRLRSILPAGGRGNFSILVIGVAVLAVLWVVKCVYTVQPDEVGQELVFGNPKDEVSTQGLHFHFWPIETVAKVPTRVQRVLIGSNDPDRRAGAETNLMLSADQNIVETNFSVLWRVDDPKLYLFNVAEPEALLHSVADSAMREVVGRSSAEEVRTERRAQIEDGVMELVQRVLKDYGAGIAIVGVQLERADPPSEVADAFEEVQRAQQDLDRFQREADAYANRRLGDARAEAAEITESAVGYRQQVIAQAVGESQRFLSVLSQYEQAEDVTRERLYLETMERILQNSNKIILESSASSNVLPYLPLDRLQQNQQGGRSQTSTGGQGTTSSLPTQEASQ